MVERENKTPSLSVQKIFDLCVPSSSCAVHSTPTGVQLSVLNVADLEGGRADNYTLIKRVKPACSFIFHESCFSLPKSYFGDQAINLDRLLEVSLPFPLRMTDYTDGGETLVLANGNRSD